MLATRPEVNIRPFHPVDQPQVLELMKGELGADEIRRRTSDLWNWKHINSHFGPSYVWLACNPEDEVVGLRAFMRWQFQCQGRTIRAARPVDTATRSDYRRIGIFSRLTKHALEATSDNGVELIFNTPNQYSMPGYLKLGWTDMGSVRPMIKVLNPARFWWGMARKRVFGSKSEVYSPQSFCRQNLDGVDVLLSDTASLDTLLQSSSSLYGDGDTLISNRSPEYLDWRYAQHPFIDYKVVTIVRGGRLDGCAVFRTNTRFGLKEVVLSELFLSGPDITLVKQLIQDLKRAVTADYLVIYYKDGSWLQQSLKKCGFRVVPRIGMKMTVRPLQDIPVDPLNMDNWALSLGDLELF